MYKLKYHTLNKVDRKKLKEEFKNTEYGKSLNKRFIRLYIIGTLGIFFSIYLFYSYKSNWDLIPATILLIASLVFIISPFIIKPNKLNDYLIKKQKNNKQK